MKKIELIKAIPILPFAYVDSLKTREKSQQYAHCRKWSHTVLRFLGLSLDIQGVEQLKEAETYYFVCNHQGTLDPAYQTKATIVPISLSNSYVLDVAKDSSKQCKIVFGKPIPYEQYKDVDKDAFCDSLQKWIASQIEKSK